MLPSDFHYYSGADTYSCNMPNGIIIYHKYVEKRIAFHKNRRIDYVAKVTFLRKCIFCNKLSTPKRVQIRSFFGGESSKELRDGENSWVHGPCCVGCWNRVRQLSKKHYECQEAALDVRRALRQLKMRKL